MESNKVIRIFVEMIIFVLMIAVLLNSVSATPADQNFDAAGVGDKGTQSYTLDGVIYTTNDGSGLNINIVNDGNIASDADLALGYRSSGVNQATQVSFKTSDGSEFKLNSFVISTGLGDTTVTVKGYRDDSEVASSSATTASFTTFDVSANSAWENIDEVRMTGADLDIDIDDIDFSPAVLPTYTVTYNGNTNTGGSVPTDGNSYNNGDTVTVLGNTGNLVKTGYAFTGWNTVSGGSGTSYNGGDTFSMGSSNVILYAQWIGIPVADFSSNVTSGEVPLTVGFTDSSTNTPTSWLWDFGDGTNSTDQNPTHTYTSVGTYSVSLNATNAGGSNISTQSNYIIAAIDPVANFTSNVTSGVVSLPVSFTDLSTNSPTGWAWYFGDEDMSDAWNEVNSSAGWTGRNGPSSVMLSDGTIVIMGGYDGDSGFKNDVWRSTDGGATWTEVNSSAEWSVRYEHSSVVLPDDSIVLMGGANVGARLNDVWRSTDAGATWTEINSSAGWPARYYASSVLLPDNSIVLMGGYDDTGATYMNDVWRSTDGGTTWTEINSSAGWSARFEHRSVVLPDGSIVLMGGHAASFENDVWQSTDGGVTWTELNSSAGWSAREGHNCVVLPDGSIILMGGGQGTEYANDVWRSTDNGATWVEVNSGADWSVRGRFCNEVLPDGSIILMGGITGGSTRNNDVWSLTTASSTEQNPAHTYTQTGIYQVSLQSFNPAGYDSIIQVNYITAAVTPVANFSANITEGAVPLSVNFTDLSLNSPTSWFWDFGDGTNSTDQNPTHTYSSVGTYNVSLNAINIGGSNVSTQLSYITAAVIPVANFSSNVTEGAVPLSVNFTDTSTNSPTSWLWDFGDGNTSTSENPTHIYSSTGTYNVSLNVSNVAGSNISTQLSYITTAVTPVANFSANVTEGAIPLSVSFTDLSLNSPNSWMWNFGDGNTSTVQNPTHVYASVGTYNVSLNVTNVGGSNVSTQLSYIITAISPVANFSSNVTEGAIPLSVNFTDLSTNSPTSWLWDFGDGTNSTDQNPTHVFLSVGTYNVSLNATNVGGSNVSTQLSYITTAATPVSNFSANTTEGAVPMSVNFTDLSLNSPTGWLWNFGDGNTSTDQNPTHSYSSAGIYNVSLNVTNVGGSNVSTQLSYITAYTVPAADFNANVTEGAAPLTVNFTDLSTNMPTSWAWDFGDGNTSTGQNPTYTYVSAGTYNVSLNATNVAGNNVSTQTAYISVYITPVANFNASVTSGIAPLSVTFTDLSNNTPTSWLWDFGDGSNSTSQNPTHSYTTAGSYNVTLNATNIAGSNVSVVTGYINVSAASTPVSVVSNDDGVRASVSQGQDPKIVSSSASSVKRVTGGSEVEYDFSDSGTPVLGVIFDAKTDEGLVVAKVQVLSSNPDGVPAQSVHHSYQVMSIDVGSEGTISKDSADNIQIRFKVSKQWIEENNIDVSTIRLTRFHGEQWNDLPTYQEREEDGYIYFYAETPGFSIFEVVGDEIGSTATETVETATPVTEEVAEPAEEDETPDTPGFTALAGIVFVSLAVLIRRN